MVTRASWVWLVWAGCNPTYIPPVEDDCEVLDGAICLDGTLGDSDTDTDVDATQPGGETGLDALEVVSVTIQPSSGVVNTSVLSCESTVTPDAPGVSVAYAWSNETTSTVLGDEQELVLDADKALPGHEVRCAVTASDGVSSDTESATVTVGNRSPVVGTPSLSPDPFYNDSTVTCAASASDPDGTTPTVTYAWSNQTTSSGLGSGFSLTLTPSAALPGHEIRCTATASDGSLTAEASVTGTVGNRAPVVSVPTLAPSRPSVGSVATCAATATDPDGTTPALTYVWRNVTEDRVFASGAQVMVPLADVKPGDTVRCEATASDGELSDTRSSSGAATWGAGESMTTALLGTVRYIPPGSFEMGCREGRDDVAGVVCEPASPVETEREVPTRDVTLTKAFWMMESELSQGMWTTGLGFTNPSFNTTSETSRPVERVSWWEALAAANETSRRDGLAECYTLTGCSGTVGDDWSCTEVAVTAPSDHPKDCAGWRLPTEAEWEYAARAGTSFPYSGGDNVDQVAWYSSNSGSQTKPVCTTPSPRNAWGLCDMSGNVWEWVWDGYVSSYTDTGAEVTDPQRAEPVVGTNRVLRGGFADNDAQRMRVARRVPDSPLSRRRYLGFRLVRSAP